MDENKILELLTRKMAGEATPSELEELERLMSAYPDALYYQQILKELWVHPKEEDIGKIFRKHKLIHRTDFEFAEPEKEAGYLNSFKKHRVVLSAAAVLIVFFSVLFLFFPRDQFQSDLKVTEIVSGKGVRKKVVLPDGTQVWLNADSKLSYDPGMTGKSQRLVQLSGEAFFDVAHNKERPFIIKTNKYNIKVLGTAFNVRAYPSEKKSETTLIRGMVELTVNNQTQQKIILKPAEKFALLEKNTKKSRVNDMRETVNDVKLVIENIEPVKIGNEKYIEETSWVENKLVFQHESFEELVPKLERWYNVNIYLKHEEVKSYHFTGVFTKETITEALSAMQLIRPFNFKVQEHDLIITRE